MCRCSTVGGARCRGAAVDRSQASHHEPRHRRIPNWTYQGTSQERFLMPRWHIATTPVQIFSLLFRAARVEGKVDDVDISKAYYLMPARPPDAPGDAHGVIFVGNWRVIDVAHGWGEIWTRPGLDRKTRSCITLTALVALGHLEELKLHVRAAQRPHGRRDKGGPAPERHLLRGAGRQLRLRRRPPCASRPRRASRSGRGRTRVMSFDPYHSTGRHSARRRSPRTSRSPCGTRKPSRAPGRTGILLCSGTV